MRLFEIQAHSMPEFDRLLVFMRDKGIRVEDIYGPKHKFLVYLSKRQVADLEERGVDLRSPSIQSRYNAD